MTWKDSLERKTLISPQIETCITLCLYVCINTNLDTYYTFITINNKCHLLAALFYSHLHIMLNVN